MDSTGRAATPNYFLGFFGDLITVCAYTYIFTVAWFVPHAYLGDYVGGSLLAFFIIAVWGYRYGYNLLQQFFGYAGTGLKVGLPTWGKLFLGGIALGAVAGIVVAPYRVIRYPITLFNADAPHLDQEEPHG